ncbi:MAG: phosphodiester glycosidase family protein, partial [Clostridia bacterium]|nr:phosphodiester glycosidase family protein [Clostridia bacterium]
MKLKKRTALLSVFLVAVFQINVFASVLGELTGGNRVTMTDEAEFYHYTYNTDSTVQSEYYVDYKPNKDVVPIVVNGDAIYGKRTITQAAQYMKDNGMKPLMGINADYFSYQTGIPIGHTVIDGELVTSDTTGQNAIGFNSDGTGFVSWLEIQSRFITYTGEEMTLDCINKWCQPTISTSYLLTDKFGSSTKTSGNCKFIIFSVVDGKLAIGNSIFLKVEEKFDYDGDIAIPEGKLVLVMTNTYGDVAKLGFMDSLQIGQELQLKTESVYDKEKWAAAQHGMGSVGGRLIENGTVYTQFEAGTAPRTAVGIKADGSIVFYVIDGRQPSVSTGVQIKTLAKRMKELGCVDAINLDGGGSTAIAGVFPGSDEFTVANSPSDGSLRKCANYIFLKDMRTNVLPAYKFDVNVSANRRFLAGYEEVIDLRSVTDGNGNPVDISAVSYYVDNSDGSAVTLNGNVVKADGNGVGYVTLSAGDSKHHISYTVLKSPTKISAFVEGSQVSELRLLKGSNEAVDIDARSYVHSS